MVIDKPDISNGQTNTKESTKVDTKLGLNDQGNKYIKIYKRDKMSNHPEPNDHVTKKDSTNLDKIVIKNTLNPIKGGAGGLSDQVSNPNRGQVLNICKIILNDMLQSLMIKKNRES